MKHHEGPRQLESRSPGSESCSYPELKSPRTSRGKKLPKGGRSKERIGKIVVHTIDGVEHFGAQIELATEPVPDVLHEAEVEIRGRRAAKCVAPAVAEGAERWHRERAGVEPRILCRSRQRGFAG